MKNMRAEQICMFELLDEKPKITKPIRLIEFFAGYGSQNLALKYIGANYESWKICEWATKSIQAYKDLHFENDNSDYSSGMSFEQVIDYLFEKGISADYNKPMEYSQIKRKGEKWCRQVYNNIIATDNLVNIQQVKGSDLKIVDVDKYDYILTYSFPCQDLSLAGKGAGMSKDSGTRSSMLWEVGRILRECSEIGSLPQVLLMENVTQVHSKKNKEMFDMWIKELDELGYTSYWEDMNAKNYGIPQNRNRTFMVSILRSWNCGEYKFPKGFPLTLRLKDLLEDEVDEKYYLSDKMIKYISSTGTGGYQNGDSRINLDVARPITTDPNKRAGTTNYLCEDLPVGYNLADIKQNRLYGIFDTESTKHQAGSVWDIEGLCPTLDTMQGGYRQPCIEIPENTLKGYAEAFKGDGVYINRPHQKRGCVQKGMIQTLKTSVDDVGVVVKVGNYSPSGHNASSVVSGEGIAPTVMENHGTVTAVVEDTKIFACAQRGRENGQQIEISNREYANAITTVQKDSMITNNLRIRKLTPLECWRLMGVQDCDFYRVAKNQSASSLYHLSGDSIVCQVLMSLFSHLIR